MRGLGSKARWGATLAFVSLVSLAAVTPAGTAHAQTPSEIAAAQGWFSEGLELERSSRWKDALERFRRVAAVKRTPQVDFHVGLCESRVGELVPALVDLARALESARAQGVATVVTAAGAELDALRPRVPHLRIAVPAGATVTAATIDDRPLASVALAEPVPVDPGTHAVVITFASGAFTKSVTLAEGERATLQVIVPAAAAAATSPPATQAPPPPPPDTAPAAKSPAAGGSSTLGWVIVGAGGAALVGSAIFWGMRGSEISTLDAACGADRSRCPDSARSSYDAGKTDTLVSAVLAGVGVVGVGIGVTLLLTNKPGPSTASASVAPVMLPGGGGASFSARF